MFSAFFTIKVNIVIIENLGTADKPKGKKLVLVLVSIFMYFLCNFPLITDVRSG